MRIFLFFFAFVSCMFGYAQYPKTKADITSYFETNISNLRMIEGKYDVIQRTIPGTFARSMGITPSTTRREYYIYYNRSLDKFYVLYDYGSEGHLLPTMFDIRPYGENRYTLADSYGNLVEIQNAKNFGIVDRHMEEHATIESYFTKTYPTPEMYAQAVTPQEWSGTGFALKNGHLITNYHVIKGAGVISVQGVLGNFDVTYKACVIATDLANDIALLKICDSKFTGFGDIPYSLRSNVADVGESVFALGYPIADVMGDEIKFTDGKISSRTGIQGAVNVYQISVPIQPGNSGGPLFDLQGRIVGITTASLNKDMFDAENVNYAVKTGYILNLIDSSVGRDIIPNGTNMANMSIPQKIKNVKNFIFFIKCKK